MGNSEDAALAETAEQLLTDASALVRGAAVWALGQLDRARLARLAPALRAQESDPHVQDEWATMLP
jgi:epoxyqueuosine reductase